MQNIIKSLLMSYGRVRNKTIAKAKNRTTVKVKNKTIVKAKNTPTPKVISIDDKAQKSLKEISKEICKGEEENYVSGLNINECFEIGYMYLQKATAEVMKTVQSESVYKSFANRTKLLKLWNTRIENMLVSNISKCYPDHKFITEHMINAEAHEVHVLTNEPTWLIDPISGSMNFMHGFPNAAVSVAFWLNQQPQFGIVLNPFLDQCFTCQQGFGSFMNVNPLKVSNCSELSNALVMHELQTQSIYRDKNMENLNRVIRVAHAMRSVGSTALNMCMVAQGYADAYYEFGCHSWDVAAAMLAVQEAGGVVVDPSMGPFNLMSRRVLCAATPQLAEQLSSVLIQLNPRPRDDEKRILSNQNSMDSMDSTTKRRPKKLPSVQTDIKEFQDYRKTRSTKRKIETTCSDPELPN